MEAEAHSLERAVRGADQRLAGSVRVSTTEMLGARFIAPHLAAFAELHPEITVELACTNIPVHLGRREADIALRLAQPREDNLVVKRLALIHLSLYASRDYLARRGVPSRPDKSLAGHNFVSFARSRAFGIENDWLEKRLEGARTVLRSDSVSAMFSATVAGLGIALLPDVVAGAEPALVRIATRDSPAPRVVWQAVHKDLARAPRIRTLLNFLASGALGGLPGAAGRRR
jgi:DNA-binding transcriptional LysR family regulator